jgi:DNA-binding response OmpR family regulator
VTEVCTVLVVEPSDLFREFLEVVVDHAGYEVTTVADLSTAVRRLRRQRFHILLLAFAAGQDEAATLSCAQLARAKGSAVIILLDDWSLRRSFADRGYATLSKPFSPAQLIAELEGLYRRGLGCEPRTDET